VSAVTALLERDAPVRRRVVALFVALTAANIAAWIWALAAFRDYPLLLGTALLAYGLGLRHALDADHIAAIDNVTRKLMQDGQRPVAVGFFFSLGHSTVVIVASIAIAAVAANTSFGGLRGIGGTIGTVVSATFLIIIAIMNVFILANVYKTFRLVSEGRTIAAGEMDQLTSGGKFLARIFRPLFGVIRSSWNMYPLGFLFGLGFDTATEIGLLGISAASAAKGMPIWSILVFPALFTAAMSLVDSTDSVLMLGAYGWAFTRPVRKLYYNLTITAVSIIVAALVGGIEALGLIGEKLALHGPFWDAVADLASNLGSLGYLIVGIFVASWGVAALIYRLKGFGALDATDVSDTAPTGETV
jgi:high-affinity nickel-transport protein